MSDLSAGLNAARVYAHDYARRPPKWRPPTGEEIASMRKALGLSQQAFADRFGFTLTALRKWEQDVAEPEQVACMVLRMIQADHIRVSALVAQTRDNPEYVDA